MEKEELKRLHNTEQEILDEIDRICKKNNLTYFLVGGTLLGAVRHHGFIPWDDDLDIGMPREDYLKFLEISEKELGEKYVLQYHKNEPEYWLPFAKVRKKNTLYLEMFSSDKVEHKGIWVDIFPLDYSCGKDKKSSVLKYKISRFLKSVLVDAERGRVCKERNIKFHSPTKVRLAIKLMNLFKISKKSIISLHDKVVVSKKKTGIFMNYGSQYGIIKQTIPTDKYLPVKYLQFEGKEYPVPGEYITVLEYIYGKNYMQLPPEEKRITHNPLAISFDCGE